MKNVKKRIWLTFSKLKRGVNMMVKPIHMQSMESLIGPPLDHIIKGDSSVHMLLFTWFWCGSSEVLGQSVSLGMVFGHLALVSIWKSLIL